MLVNQLILHPADPLAVPARPDQLIERLQALGFAGEALPRTGPRAYRIGDRFLRLVSFLGCSPHIRLEPPADDSVAFCHLVIDGPRQAPQLITGSNTRPPRCPACGTTYGDWRTRLADNPPGGPAAIWPCTGCGAPNPPHRLKWRNQAGTGCLFIRIFDVFPNEAEPADELLTALASTTGGEWQYFYFAGG
jgi:hypothetical protein